MSKTVVAIGDLHCGSVAGLTPPGWQVSKDRFPNISALQHEAWREYQKIAREWVEPDLLIVNGDAIDGHGKRSGGTELLTSDMDEQCDMAIKVIRSFKPKQVIMTYGTPYHVAGESGVDFERIIARQVDAEIHSHAFIKVDGVMFDCKHKVGSSAVPHGRYTAVAKEKLWNMLWAEQDENQPNSDIILRSHVHYYGFCGTDKALMMTLPALQCAHTKFGARQCSGVVNWGAVRFEINKGEYTWEAKTKRLQGEKARIVEL